MKTEAKIWDSDFFGIKIASVTVGKSDTTDTIDRELIRLKQQKYRMVYLFSPVQLNPGNIGKWLLADRKRSYIMDSPQPRQPHNDVAAFSSDPHQLHSLAITAGAYSRFAKDPHILPEDFQRLYITWIDNSVNKGFTDYVFTARDGKETHAALITATRRDDVLSIGLLATHPDHRHHGLARMLVERMEQEAYSLGIPLEVTTQADNTAACAFYTACNFNSFTDTFVYHIWM